MMNATYSPEDNKLRLYSTTRLDPETYSRVKKAGFIWAPKQELFVAPAWTPSREDLLLELCGEIDDEDTSLVDRAEMRAERFEEYSDKRAEESDQAHKVVDSIVEHIPFGQPILVGHHSERRARKDAERIKNGMRKAIALWETSQYWQMRAKGAIRAAKYKERPDVRARRIKGLEADIRRCKAAYTPNEKQRPIMQRRWNAERNSEPVPHVWCGQSRGGHWVAVEDLPNIEKHYSRWISHYENRLLYERTMLEEQGASDLLKPKPKPEQPPLCNYRAPEGFIMVPNIYNRGELEKYRQVEMTRADYAKINTDYKGTRVIENSHRVRSALVRSELVCVFLTDSKVHEKPAPVELKPKGPSPESIRMAEARVQRAEERREDPKEKKIEAMKDTLKQGISVVSAPQLFNTPPRIADHMVDLAEIEAGMDILEPQGGMGNLLTAILKHVPCGYEVSPGMCSKPNTEGTQPIDCAHCTLGTQQALKAQIRLRAVEKNLNLVDLLRNKFPELNIMGADFLSCNGNLGKFDRIIMNPPFVNGEDIKHIRHALGLLKPRGKVISLCANGPRQREAFMEMADYWEDLPAGSFKNQGTNVNVALMVLSA